MGSGASKKTGGQPVVLVIGLSYSGKRALINRLCYDRFVHVGTTADDAPVGALVGTYVPTSVVFSKHTMSHEQRQSARDLKQSLVLHVVDAADKLRREFALSLHDHWIKHAPKHAVHCLVVTKADAVDVDCDALVRTFSTLTGSTFSKLVAVSASDGAGIADLAAFLRFTFPSTASLRQPKETSQVMHAEP
eukprot:ANDGO_00986.mRNA.1 hypothetical protein